MSQREMKRELDGMTKENSRMGAPLINRTSSVLADEAYAYIITHDPPYSSVLLCLTVANRAEVLTSKDPALRLLAVINLISGLIGSDSGTGRTGSPDLDLACTWARQKGKGGSSHLMSAMTAAGSIAALPLPLSRA
jgi:hypothetical protein